MEFEALKTVADEITMPEEMKNRIRSNCKNQMQKQRKEIPMKNTKPVSIRKYAAAFTVLILCVSLSVSALAAPDMLKGFFQHITDYRGAVVGTTYEQATDEIHLQVSIANNTLHTVVTFTDPQIAPYCYAEKLSIGSYKVLDTMGNVIKEGSTNAHAINSGQTEFYISLTDLKPGSYSLTVDTFITEKKADQPLTISGNWTCAFTK